jgi:hypothetical protein
MLNPNELWLWHTQSPSGERLPVFRAATRDDAVEYCERVGWTELQHLQGFCPRVYEVDRATGDVVRREVSDA